MKLAKGERYGGRQKGTPNKVNASLRSTIAAFIEKDFKTVQELIRQMEPKDRVTYYIKLMDFVLPKNTAVDITSDGQPLNSGVFEVEIVNGKKCDSKS